MKVVAPGTATSYSLDLIPRFYPCTTVVVSLYNEADREVTTPTSTYSIVDGIMKVNFTYTFVNKDRYQIKITDTASDVVYRGIVRCTDQETQDYKITNGIYVYE